MSNGDAKQSRKSNLSASCTVMALAAALWRSRCLFFAVLCAYVDGKSQKARAHEQMPCTKEAVLLEEEYNNSFFSAQ